MKILHVARYGSVKGGTEAYVAALCAAQREAGHEVALAYRFDPDAARPEVRAGIEVAAITSRNETPTTVERAEALRAAEAFAPDVIHVHNAEAAWLPATLREVAPVLSAVHDHRLDCPTGTRYWAAWNRACDIAPGGRCLGYNVAAHCGSLRANASLEPYLRWKRLHRAASAPGAPAIQVFSAFMRDQLVRVGIAAPIEVTPYPCPELPAPASAIARDDARPLVFATGRITKEKGFELLLDALDEILRPVRLVIAGDGHYAATIRRKAAAAPPRHVVETIGWVDRGALAAWYAAADVVAVPSAWPEPFGIVGLEAMSAGAPVVATATGGIGEWLDDGVTGIAVPPRDAKAFGAAIERLCADPALRERMGAAARERIAREFTIAGHVERVAAVYDKICRSREEAA